MKIVLCFSDGVIVTTIKESFRMKKNASHSELPELEGGSAFLERPKNTSGRLFCSSGNIGSLISSLPEWRHVLATFEKEDKLVVPLPSRNVQFSRSTSLLPIIQELFLISFAKVSIVGIRFWKASLFKWNDTRNYLLLPRQQLYVHVNVNRDQNYWYTSQNRPLFPQRWNY